MDCDTVTRSIRNKPDLFAIIACWLMGGLAILILCSGCENSSDNRIGTKSDRNKKIPPSKLLNIYGPNMADIECHITSDDGFFSTAQTQFSRRAGVAVSTSGKGVLIIASLGDNNLAAQGDTTFRVCMSGMGGMGGISGGDVTTVSLEAIYLADVNAALLLAEIPGASFSMDLADSQSIIAGGELAIIYFTPEGRASICEGVIESVGEPDAAHVSVLTVSIPENMEISCGAAFASHGGGLAGIVTGSNGLGSVNIIPAANLMQPDYWQYAGDRYDITTMLKSVKKH